MTASSKGKDAREISNAGSRMDSNEERVEMKTKEKRAPRYGSDPKWDHCRVVLFVCCLWELGKGVSEQKHLTSGR
jgi:hypothetical protein